VPSHALRATLVAAFALAVAAVPAAATDYAETARNIIPSGQPGGIPIPAGADEQAKMYDSLTPLAGDVTASTLDTAFKSERLGADPAEGPFRTESTPRKGVTIVRDRFGVPHITGRTREDVVWAAGWVLQEDRGLLIQQARYPARLAAVDAANVDAFALVVGLKAFQPTQQINRMIERQTGVLRGSADGRALLREIDVYLSGINARLRAEKSQAEPWSRIDVYSIHALAGQIFGQGGGREPGSAQFLDGLRDSLGAARGQQVFDDLTNNQDPEHPHTLDRRFGYEPIPSSTKGNAVIDAGSYRPVRQPAGQAASAEPPHASNFLMVGAGRSTNGHPLFVAGPQIGYFYPGLTLEMDLKGPGFEARGATTAGFPGTILIGRGPDFAWSLTSAGSDLIDHYAETLCGGSRTKYRYKGGCRDMGKVTAGKVLGAGTIRYRTTVHGPVVGYARSGGRLVALSRKRASFGRDIEWQYPFRDATLGRIRSARTFFDAFARSPFTFNAAYADDRDIAVYSAGRLPLRAPGVDPRLPTKGTGEYEWRGFLSQAGHPQQVNAADGTLVNWNNKPAAGFAAADDQFDYGTIHRVQLLDAGLAGRDKHDLASVVGAMNRAATQDLRAVVAWPTVAEVLAGGPAPSERARRMVELIAEYRARGANRLDLDGDGRVDHPGAAIMDAIWEPIADAVFQPVLGGQLARFKTLAGADANTEDDFTSGRLGHVDKDLRRLLGKPERGPYSQRYCGRGDLAACRAALWAAIDAAGAALEAAQGADPAAWRASAEAEKIGFLPGLLPYKLRYTNRPSGIQQVITFRGHRPGQR